MSAPDPRLRFFLGAKVGLLATIGYRSIQGMTASRSAMHFDYWTWRLIPFHPAPFLLGDFRRVKRFAGCLPSIARVAGAVFIIHPTA